MTEKELKLRPRELDVEQLRKLGVDTSDLERQMKEWDEAQAKENTNDIT